MNPINWARVPGPVLDLLRRVKDIENRPQGWSDAVAADAVSTWFLDHGVDPNVPAHQIPAADDERVTYERLIQVTCTAYWELDERDLDSAIAAAVNGTVVRVEDNEASEMHWIELDVHEVTPFPCCP
ncbi:hypothetical protein [Spirillospora sp. CA-294931]|uniref:hypothetical protein n=1 Tax=Spirillospora sp. CA-294931 TaxID=3240042 RepID=UPI003D8C92F0